MKVYEKVGAYLDKQGINQDALAKKCNIPIDVFDEMLNGKREMYAEELRAICYALEVKPEVFVNTK